MGDEFHGNGWTYNTATEMLLGTVLGVDDACGDALRTTTIRGLGLVDLVHLHMHGSLCRLLFSGRGRRAGTARPVAELQSPAKFEFGMVAYFRKHVTSHTNFAHVALQKRVSVERSYGRWD